MGGSYAGLFAARVLSDYAEDVVVMEPDVIGDDGLGRRTPQRHQLHALLSMGHTQLERWFPGITAGLVAGGARLGEGDDVQFYLDGRLKAPVAGARMLGVTRPFLEHHLRRRVEDLENVRFIQTQVADLVLQGDRVTGVVTAAPESGGGEGETLAAEFVVDAMGRNSPVEGWLARHGWESAPVDSMRIDLGYATAAFHRGDELGSTVIAHSSPGPASGYQPTLTEPGALAAVEGERWSVVLAGYADHRPGPDRAEFLRRMRRCVAPIRTVADTSEMIGDVKTYRFVESRRRVHSRLSRFPGGLVVVGDALASVNPVYGQGLTLSALEANALGSYLRSTPYPQAPAWDYFRLAEAVVDAAWQLSTAADLAQPHVTGPYPRGYRVQKWVADKLTEASVVDSAVNAQYMGVVNMELPPKALTDPRFLARAARVLLSS
ncbi:FAD-dependent oxidoreductase [Streptomyces sp. NBC_00691]|uniref:FAD-dependent oxidoreductase n=1 Tax=Streptomyces sp. NBC_00691 TaxID=2903671 RepID=UPI002E31EB9B|nr:FAD-dependent monooxygenase [Streptomyces sp. NBC_00691]